MTSPTVVVFGSLNMDLVVRVERAPHAGETVAAESFLMNPGGKGANQAVACARQAVRVVMAGRVGDDDFGAALKSALQRQGVDASTVQVDSGSSGIAMITVDDAAQNRIAVVGGANAEVSEADAEGLRSPLREAGLLLLQLEIPLPAVIRAAQVARSLGCTVLLNPAPARMLPPELLALVDILVVNETEAQVLTGLNNVDASNAAEAAALLARRGPRDVIVTLGEHGVVWHGPLGTRSVPAVPVRAVDTTAAGDTFIGALAALRVEGRSMDEALAHAVKAAALCVTRHGAQASIPSRAEVDAFEAGVC